jgi:hypothetical protein
LTLLSVDVSLSKEELSGLRRAKERSIGRAGVRIGTVLQTKWEFIEFAFYFPDFLKWQIFNLVFLESRETR